MPQHPYIFDADSLVQDRSDCLREARALAPGSERNQKRQVARSLKRLLDAQNKMLKNSILLAPKILQQ